MWSECDRHVFLTVVSPYATAMQRFLSRNGLARRRELSANAASSTIRRHTGEIMFFSFDGLDGVGKSTQINLFAEWLRAGGHDVVTCCDPGSTPLGDWIRDMLLGRRLRIDGVSEMLLFMSARAQLVEEVIRPALARKQVVVSDRYLLANVVYQGHAGGLDVETIWRIGEVATQGLKPDLVFVLDMPPERAAARIERPLDHMETRGEAYQARLRQGFLAEAAKDPEHIRVIDATRAIDVVQADIRAAAQHVLVSH